MNNPVTTTRTVRYTIADAIVVAQVRFYKCTSEWEVEEIDAWMESGEEGYDGPGLSEDDLMSIYVKRLEKVEPLWNLVVDFAREELG